jgi:YCII-related domain
MTPAERATMDEHAHYWSDLATQGRALAFGPVADPQGPYGIAIVLAEDVAAAEAIRDRDPALTSPHGFRSELSPMLALVTPEGRYDGPRAEPPG